MTAQEKYNERQQSISELMKQMQELLKAHTKEQKQNPKNWGYAGELGYVEEQLQELVDFLK